MVGNCQRDDLSVLRAESRTVDLEVAPGRDGAADTALCAAARAIRAMSW